MQVTNGCGTVYSDTVQISTAADFGLSFSSSNDAPSVLCTGENFDFTETSGSILGSLFGFKGNKVYMAVAGSRIFYVVHYQSLRRTTHGFYGFLLIMTGTANFTVNNNTNAPVTKNLIITPNILKR